MSAQEVLKLKKWAVIGASNKKDGYGYKIYRRLKEEGYTVYPITPNYDEVDGDKAYRTVKDLPELVDVAEFIVTKEVGLKVIKDVAKSGIKNVWLQPMTRSKEIREITEKFELNVVESCVLKELRQLDK